MSFSVRRTLALAALALVVGACGDSTGSETGDRGSLSFSYSGAVSGQFSADGKFRRFDADDEYAVGLLDRASGEILLIATRPSPAGGEDVFAAQSVGTRGTVTCTVSTPSAECNLASALALGLDTQSEEADRAFSGIVGSMTVDQTEAGRVRGSFFFTLADEEDVTGNPARVQVTSGTFDVPLLDDNQFALMPREMQLRARRMQRAAAARP